MAGGVENDLYNATIVAIADALDLCPETKTPARTDAGGRCDWVLLIACYKTAVKFALSVQMVQPAPAARVMLAAPLMSPAAGAIVTVELPLFWTKPENSCPATSTISRHSTLTFPFVPRVITAKRPTLPTRSWLAAFSTIACPNLWCLPPHLCECPHTTSLTYLLARTNFRTARDPIDRGLLSSEKRTDLSRQPSGGQWLTKMRFFRCANRFCLAKWEEISFSVCSRKPGADGAPSTPSTAKSPNVTGDA